MIWDSAGNLVAQSRQLCGVRLPEAAAGLTRDGRARLRDPLDHRGQRAGHRDRLAPRSALRAGSPPRRRARASDDPRTGSPPSTPRTSPVPSRPPSSPTAAATCPVRVDARLRECDYGRLNGCPVAELERVRLDHVDVPFPGGGQSYRDVVDATADFLDDVRRDHDGRAGARHRALGQPMGAAAPARRDAARAARQRAVRVAARLGVDARLSARWPAYALVVGSHAGSPLNSCPRGTHHRNRRSPQRRQVDALQRADQEQRARRELPVRDDRAQRRRRPAAGRAPRRARRDLRLREDPARPR